MVEISAGCIETVAAANHLVVLTGAGVSAESGVPTFRDAQTGLWAQYEPAELATPGAFQRDPELVWNWYQWRHDMVSRALPNPGHTALVEFANRLPRFTLVTQNVDGLHQRAGSQDVIELHGSIMRARCFDNHHVANGWPVDTTRTPPRCEACGSLMRPDVVWFNEALPQEALQDAVEAAGGCDVFMSIGTSATVHPAASLAWTAIEAGATVIEINPRKTPLTPHASIHIEGPAGQVLPRILADLR